LIVIVLTGRTLMNTQPLAFAPGRYISASMARLCVTPNGMVEAIRMYNNCNVIEVRGSWVLIMASQFAAYGIAHQLCLPVYRAKRGPGYYAVRLIQAEGVTVESEGDDSTRECQGCEHCDGEGGHTVADSRRAQEATERHVADLRAQGRLV
jgi:hypothetical protein